MTRRGWPFGVPDLNNRNGAIFRFVLVGGRFHDEVDFVPEHRDKVWIECLTWTSSGDVNVAPARIQLRNRTSAGLDCRLVS